MNLYRAAEEGEQAKAFPIVEVGAVAVPWCSEHNAPMAFDEVYCLKWALLKPSPVRGVCRLEDQRVYRIEGNKLKEAADG